MKVLVIGAGLSGCTTARLLSDRGHEVVIREKENRIGGLSITSADEETGIPYEPYGPRTFHATSPRVIEHAQRFAAFTGYKHRKGIILEGRMFPFPLTYDALKQLTRYSDILTEQSRLPETPDSTNFETYCLTRFGKTLYEYFIKNYTFRMWGCPPEQLTASWAPERIPLREKEGPLFKEEWQGQPQDGYSRWLENMASGINVITGVATHDFTGFDRVIYTAPIDALFNFDQGRLAYRSAEFHYVRDETWENSQYGVINLPQHPLFLRKCNPAVMHGVDTDRTLIQYHQSTAFNGTNMPMYPVHTRENEDRFNNYLRRAIQTGALIPAGRLGLFEYYDMDEAIENAFAVADLVEAYGNWPQAKRYKILTDLRKSH